jgi:hypothetical protein
VLFENHILAKKMPKEDHFDHPMRCCDVKKQLKATISATAKEK